MGDTEGLLVCSVALPEPKSCNSLKAAHHIIVGLEPLT